MRGKGEGMEDGKANDTVSAIKALAAKTGISPQDVTIGLIGRLTQCCPGGECVTCEYRSVCPEGGPDELAEPSPAIQ